MTPEERLQALARPVEEKWFLSCGDGVVWAPPLPVWLTRPGFWDEAHIYYHPFAPLFTIALVRAGGAEVPLAFVEGHWRPDYIDLVWRAGGAQLHERRTASFGGRFTSTWSFEGEVPTGAHIVAFTAQPGPDVRSAGVGPWGLRWTRTLWDRRGEPLDVFATLAADHPARWSAVRSEGSVGHPVWRHTPFAERWGTGGLREELRLEGISHDGLVWVALDAEVPRREKISFTIRIVPTTPMLEAKAAVSPDPSTAWRSFFQDFPSFSCSDPYLQRYYDYRVYGLGLNRLQGGAGYLAHSAIAEGVGPFHTPISYSTQCHMLETRWHREGDLARGMFLNFVEGQREDGCLPGMLFPHTRDERAFYHANWGDAVLAVDTVHPDPDFSALAYESLRRYARWLDQARDPQRTGLIEVHDQYETGQEYMSRYLAVDPDADRYGWEDRIRLQGIDATVYAYLLNRALVALSGRLGRAGDTSGFIEARERIGRAILERAWDENLGFFCDLDPRTQTRTGVKAAVGFYPLLTDLLEDHHVARLIERLDSPSEFAAPFPVPSSSLDDPQFNADAEWKGRRHLCPWNGRTWPMVDSHVVDGLLRQWQAGRRSVGATAARLLTRFVRMMFDAGDLARPNAFEHYNPLTGHPSAYRGIDDYLHSWVLDLLIRGVAGLEPTVSGIVVDPLPLDVEEVRLDWAWIRGRDVSVRRKGAEVEVLVEGRRHFGRVGKPLEIFL